MPEPEAQQKADEEAALAARAEALATATEVRHAFVKQRYGSAYTELADAIAGVAIDDAVDAAGLDRLTRMVVAQWIARHEANLARLYDSRYGDEPDAVAYLDQLVGDGYSLSEAEQSLYDDLSAEIAEEAELADQAEAQAATAA